MTAIHTLPTARKADNRPPSLPGIWPTVTAQLAGHVVETCHRNRQIGLITGPSGIGKTTAVKAAVAKLRGEEEAASYVMMTQAAQGMQPGLLRIANRLGLETDRQMGASELHDAICRAFRYADTVLVIDEAQFASDALLQAIRNIWDELQGERRPIGIVLVGTPDLARRIDAPVSRKAGGFSPLRGRIGARAALDGLDGDDVAAIAGHLGLDGNAPRKVLDLAARLPGGLHNVDRLVTQARRAAGAVPVTLQHLQDAALVAGVAS